MKYIVLAGRVLFSFIFLYSAPNHFTNAYIGFARTSGVPYAEILVPFSGVLALLGGLSILFDYKTKWGAVLIILFLIPVTIMMHNFWAVKDPMMMQMQLSNFLKNLSMLGGAFVISYFGAGVLIIGLLICIIRNI